MMDMFFYAHYYATNVKPRVLLYRRPPRYGLERRRQNPTFASRQWAQAFPSVSAKKEVSAGLIELYGFIA